MEAGEHHPAHLLLIFSLVLFSASQLSVNVSLSQSLGLLSLTLASFLLADSSNGPAQPREAVTAVLRRGAFWFGRWLENTDRTE